MCFQRLVQWKLLPIESPSPDTWMKAQMHFLQIFLWGSPSFHLRVLQSSEESNKEFALSVQPLCPWTKKLGPNQALVFIKPPVNHPRRSGLWSLVEMATVVGPLPSTYLIKIMKSLLLTTLYVASSTISLVLIPWLLYLLYTIAFRDGSLLLGNPSNSILVIYVTLNSYQKASSHLSLMQLFILGNRGLPHTPWLIDLGLCSLSIIM